MKIDNTLFTPFDFTLRCVVLFIELACFALVYLGIPSGTWSFTWVFHHELSSLDDSLLQPGQIRETSIYLTSLSLLLPMIIWGIIPYCSLNVIFPPRIRLCADITLFLLEIMSVSFCVRVISIVLTWWTRLQSAGLWRAASQCERLAIFLGLVVFIALILNILLLSVLLFDRPAIVRQVINEGREQSQRFLNHLGMRGLTSIKDEKATTVSV